MSDVELTTKDFKALSSEVRNSILKLLHERNHTLSEFAKKMNMAMPTVKQHLRVLEEVGLIEIKDEGRKWKYYTLTRKGRKVVAPEETNFLIVIGGTFVGLAVLVVLFSAVFLTGNIQSVSDVSSMNDFKVQNALASIEADKSTAPLADSEERTASSTAEEVITAGSSGAFEFDFNAIDENMLQECVTECNACNPVTESCSQECNECLQAVLQEA
jgi:DNA-binding transcriptional ArsR family regulator